MSIADAIQDEIMDEMEDLMESKLEAAIDSAMDMWLDANADRIFEKWAEEHPTEMEAMVKRWFEERARLEAMIKRNSGEGGGTDD